jgi:hypothetical protein
MIKRNLFVFILLALVQFGQAQTADSRIAFGLSGAKTLYVGDYSVGGSGIVGDNSFGSGGNGIYDFGHTELYILANPKFPIGYWSSGFSLNTYLSSSFDLGIQEFYGDYGYFNSDKENFIAMKFETSIFAHYKFNNGYILAQNAKLSPFLSVGFGMASYYRNFKDKFGSRGNFTGIDFIVPLGAGIKYQFSDKFAFQYQYLYNFTNSDIHDQHMGGTGIESSKKGNDAWGEHILSVIYSIKTPYFDKIVPRKSHSDNKTNSWKPPVVNRKLQSDNKTNSWKPRYEYKDNSWKSHGYRK